MVGDSHPNHIWSNLMNPTDNLDRDQQILSRLARIEHKVESLEQTTAFALRADADRHFDSMRKIFGKSKRRAQVYLAVNGIRGVVEIAEHLRMQRQNVGPDLKHLTDEGLIEIIDTEGGKDIYVKKPLDRTLRVSKFLREEFTLGPDGLPSAQVNGRRTRVAQKGKRT
jgi:DNA-binding transcriptional ArsR family regulator